MNFFRKFMAVGALVLATALLAVSSAWGQPFISNTVIFDNFNDNSLHSMWEHDTIGSGFPIPDPFETNQRIGDDHPIHRIRPWPD